MHPGRDNCILEVNWQIFDMIRNDLRRYRTRVERPNELQPSALTSSAIGTPEYVRAGLTKYVYIMQNKVLELFDRKRAGLTSKCLLNL